MFGLYIVIKNINTKKIGIKKVRIKKYIKNGHFSAISSLILKDVFIFLITMYSPNIYSLRPPILLKNIISF
jgi:hypothetical protein